MQGIYTITCTPTGERYIGKAVHIYRRWVEGKTEPGAAAYKIARENSHPVDGIGMKAPCHYSPTGFRFPAGHTEV